MKKLAKISVIAGNSFAIWVIIVAVLALLMPDWFTWIAPYISILLGIIMFGMGLTLSPGDFKAVFKEPKSVFIGVICQFTIMPGVAYLLAVLLNLPPEVAVGVILVGCCPGGTASNVIAYLAKGNTALSVAITSVSTLLAPFITPGLTYLLASKWLPVSGQDMLMSILQIVLIPIILGVAVRMIFKEKVQESTKVLPLISVITIVAVVAAVMSSNKEKIMESGLAIMGVVILHNCLGLFLGFMAAKVLKLSYKDQKSVSIEVGMQNSGLGAALASVHFSPLAAVPSAIFSVWHNISGPILATYWSKKAEEKEQETQRENIGEVEMK
ncbi:bile acid:sodium symporter family protein [Bacillus massiliglaciei]|uniref:bile acid:sodium symporter family protein n=1 Tax=Bacillus massiliglaciei TaxID=1816693 RepID=UPI000AD7B526|nr:bile acid:sodium symporter family protein [Bacillus massiliglaciei]